HLLPLQRAPRRRLVVSFFSLTRPAPSSTLFPYTTLFRSGPDEISAARGWPARSRAHPGDVRADGQRQPLHAAQRAAAPRARRFRSEEHTSELQSRSDLVCRLLLEKKKIEHRPRRRT